MNGFIAEQAEQFAIFTRVVASVLEADWQIKDAGHVEDVAITIARRSLALTGECAALLFVGQTEAAYELVEDHLRALSAGDPDWKVFAKLKRARGKALAK